MKTILSKLKQHLDIANFWQYLGVLFGAISATMIGTASGNWDIPALLTGLFYGAIGLAIVTYKK